MANFDKWAERYREIHERNLKVTGLSSDYFAEKKVKVMIANLDPNEYYTFLDIGCGDGKMAEYIPKYFKNYSGFGIDISEVSIKQAIAKNIKNFTFFAYNGHRIPFKESVVDVVILAGVLHHVSISERLPLLQEAFRVLKPSGNIFVFEHNPFNPFTRYLVATCPFDEDAILLSHVECRSLISVVGFRIVKSSFISFFPGWGPFKYLAHYEDLLHRLPFGAQYYIRAVRPL